MTQPNSQQIHALVAQRVPTAVVRTTASSSLRTVALSLLVDRALSA